MALARAALPVLLNAFFRCHRFEEFSGVWGKSPGRCFWGMVPPASIYEAQ
jgi:hypothetical protein